ncbi:glycosyltransferase involved in cell wall biosynthesis [Litorimonas taeanensis]|uniref:Glycosyltransferase involved in cell wall biosynthesis n=1 Tax=Litorimonas taeanensis TaxID=568099 RepID=A0A420WEC2_9PROT|nr:glycosyltransferase family 4 protein [Litorimonas taeanensis]RKQ69379.1 glycosyltransferase involved in cell wall biosynthesis [Litorimonas taeanensis]
MIILSVQTFPPDAGGKQVLMEGLAKAAAIHHDVLVLSDKAREGRDSQNPHYNFTVQRFGSFKPLRQRQKAKLISQLVEQEKVSHLFCDSWRSAEHLPPNLPCSVTIYAHGNEYPLGGPQKNKTKARRLIKTFAKIDHIIAVSKPTANRVRPYLPPISAPKLHIINNPVSLPTPATQQNAHFVETLWPQKKEQSTRILSLCRLIPLKGIDRAVQAVKALRDEGYALQMIIAGEGEDKLRLMKSVEQAGLGQYIHFVGHIAGPQKTALFESADIFIQPGRKIGDYEEGFGLTYLEAGLHGLPSLCGQAGGAPEAVLHEKTGLVIDGMSQINVTNGLRRLIDETEQTSHMGKDAKAFAQSHLWDKQIDLILNRVKEVRGTRCV